MFCRKTWNNTQNVMQEKKQYVENMVKPSFCVLPGCAKVEGEVNWTVME